MKSRSLGFKLIAGGILVVLIPLLAVGLFASIKSGTLIESLSRERATSLANSLSTMSQVAMEYQLKSAKTVASEMPVINAAESLKKGTDNGEETTAFITKRLEETQKSMGSDYDQFIFANAEGVIVAASLDNKGKGTNVSDRDYFKNAKNGKDTIGQVIKSRVTGNVDIVSSSPVVSASGEFLGTVLSLIKMESLAGKITSIKTGNTGYALAVDNNGMIIAHPKKDLILARDLSKEKGMETFMAKAMKHETGIENYIFEGVRKSAAFAPVPITGWSIIVTQNEDELYAESRKIRLVIAAFSSIALILTVAIIFLFSRNINGRLGLMAKDLNEISEQVAAAAEQVSASSQAVAEGTSQQAAAIQETSSSLEEMSSMTRQNADHTNQAKVFMKEAKKLGEGVVQQMANMKSAINDATKRSEQTGKVIKTIDEIAFQTNLLALNAAVEAARAGEAGAGFAIVADEVRNLAMRAAEAARTTADLIENTLIGVRKSGEFAEQTETSFQENFQISEKIWTLIDEIATASGEQAEGVRQINTAVSQMDKVTQVSASTAEETATASEEMNAQADQMKRVVEDLLMLVDGSRNGKGYAMPPLKQRRNQAKSPEASGRGWRLFGKEPPEDRAELPLVTMGQAG